MDTIVTPVTVITLDSTRIVHSIKADLVARYFPPVVRLVQYDQSLPVIAVSLMHNGQTYTLPSGAAANIRVHKPDATYVYNPALGCDSTRNIVYFEVTQAMAAANGDGLAIVEIVVNGDIAGTSLITLHFEENPVPEDAIESSDEWETIYELGERIIASTVTPVSTAAGMTDHNVVYLYTGTESGWNQGHMYYYNGTTWVDAGIAVTDTTLSVAGLAADAKKTGDEIATVKDGLEQLETDITNAINDVYVTDTASGAIASFPDGADGVPVKSLTVDIEPVQSGSGDPSPTNVRPISGHSTATVTRTGKNLLIYPFGNTAPRTINGVTFTPNSDGSVTANGTASAQAVYTIHASMPIPDGTYILSGGKSTNKYVELGYFNSDTATTENRVSDNGTRVATFTSHKGRITYLQLIISSGQTLTNEVFYPMIRLSSVSDATFAPYTAQTVTIDLDGTRYGGTLDATTGVLTVDRVIKTLDGSEGNWVYASGSGGYFYYNPTAALFPNIKTYDSTVISNRLKTVGDGTAFASNTFCIYNASQLNFKCDTSVNTVALFKSWLGNNPLTVVYPLATPTTVQLTAQDDITTVLGQNNVWNDCGDTTVEYRADTKLYIQKVLNG